MTAVLWLICGPFAGTRTRRRRDMPSLRPRRNMRQSRWICARLYCTKQLLEEIVPSQAFNGIIAPAASSRVWGNRERGLACNDLPHVCIFPTQHISCAFQDEVCILYTVVAGVLVENHSRCLHTCVPQAIRYPCTRVPFQDTKVQVSIVNLQDTLNAEVAWLVSLFC